ncbi:MAG: 50S ribosomal protein L25 [Verrucomicrobiota bacterium]
MSEHLKLKASKRDQIGSSASSRLRRDGQIPAILYGAGDPQTLEVNTKEFIEAIQSSSSENALVDLTIEDEGSKSHLALIQSVQHHPIKDTVLHIDFHEVRNDQKIQAHVPLVELGTATGVKNKGGVMDHLVRELHIECFPADLPSEIEVDVSHLDLEQAIHVSDIALPNGVTALNPPDVTVFMIHPPRVSTAPTDSVEEESPVAEEDSAA